MANHRGPLVALHYSAVLVAVRFRLSHRL